MNNEKPAEIIRCAREEGRRNLSEYDAKRVLAAYSITVTKEILVYRADEIPEAAREIGYPLVMKGCSPELSHKTEQNLVRV